MSVSGSVAGSSVGPPELTEAEIADLEDTHLKGIVLKGIIVFSEFEDQFLFVPYEGFVKAFPIRKMTDIVLDNPILTIEDRDTEFALVMMDKHPGFTSRIFCRVEFGK